MSIDRRVTGSLVLLDANVLYPIAVCDFILTASSLQALARPIVSAEIIAEAVRNVTAERPDLEPARIQRRFNAVRVATDGHDHASDTRFAESAIINRKDRHVVAAALYHGVDFVITNDAGLRAEIGAWLDTRRRRPQLVGALSADQFVELLIGESPVLVGEVVAAMVARMRNPRRSEREVVTALRRALPSLKALEPPG